MKTNLNFRFSTFNKRLYYPIIAIWLINLLSIGAILYGGTKTYEKFVENQDNEVVIAELQNKANRVRENSKIDPNVLDEMNGTLLKLIPDEEDYFLVINALEKLSRETRFSLLRYSINLSSTNAEKLSLTIDGSGDIDAFLTLLQRYKFGGERLITNESLEFAPDNLSSVKIILNFYHKKAATNLDGIDNRINQKDIEFIRGLKNQLEAPIITAP